MAKFEAAAGLDQLVAAMVAPQVEEIAKEVTRAAQRREPGLKMWQCLTGDTPVHGVDVSAAARRYHKGPVVRVTTASGRVFTATPEHRVLTGRGWLQLQFLRHDDHLFQVVDVDPAGTPHVQDPPTLIGDVVDAAIDAAIPGQVRTVPGRVNFDVDPAESDVEVVEADRSLRRDLETGITESIRDLSLMCADMLGSVALLPGGDFLLDLGWLPPASLCCRDSLAAEPSFLRSHPRCPDQTSIRLPADRHVVPAENCSDCLSRDPIPGADRSQGFAGAVDGDHLIFGQLDLADGATSIQLGVDVPDGNAEQASDAVSRLTTPVTTNHVVNGGLGDFPSPFPSSDDRGHPVTNRDVVLTQDGFDGSVGDPIPTTQGSDRLARQVVTSQGDLVDSCCLDVCCCPESVGLRPVTGLDTTGGECPLDAPCGNTAVVRDRSNRGPGLVATDHVVDITVNEFEGHVYDLSTASEWFLADGLIIHNSRGDSKVCESCSAMNGVTIPKNDLFEVPAFQWETRERGISHVYMDHPPGPLEPGQAAASIWWEKHQHECRCTAVPAGDYDAGITTDGPVVAGTRVTATTVAEGPRIVTAEYGTVHGAGRFPVDGTRFLGGAAAEVAGRRQRRLRGGR